jgi:hypothetical protein
MTRRPDPPWVSDDTLVMIAEDINVAIADAIARLYRIPYEQLTPDRRVARFEVHEPSHPASYTFGRLVDGKPDRWYFRRPSVPHAETEWELHAHSDNTYREVSVTGD